MDVPIAGFSHVISHKAEATLDVNEDESPEEVFLKILSLARRTIVGAPNKSSYHIILTGDLHLRCFLKFKPVVQIAKLLDY